MTASDFDEMSRQLSVLRMDLASLPDAVAGIAGRCGNRMDADVAAGFDVASLVAFVVGLFLGRHITGGPRG